MAQRLSVTVHRPVQCSTNSTPDVFLPNARLVLPTTHAAAICKGTSDIPPFDRHRHWPAILGWFLDAALANIAAACRAGEIPGQLIEGHFPAGTRTGCEDRRGRAGSMTRPAVSI